MQYLIGFIVSCGSIQIKHSNFNANTYLTKTHIIYMKKKNEVQFKRQQLESFQYLKYLKVRCETTENIRTFWVETLTF